MASTSSISGLASGLDTAGIIDQLMQLEAQPQTKLKSQQSSENSIISALRQLNTDTSSLATKAAALAKPATWNSMVATATGTGISVTAVTSAQPTSLSFTVDSLAATHQLGFTASAALTDVVAESQVTITGSDGVAHPISTGGGTLKELVAAINDSSATTGVKASTVKVADGSYRLLVESTTTGTGSAFTMTNADGTDLLGGAAVRAGTDARISLGLGITATSSTNTFTDLVPGVTVTLGAGTAVNSTGTISVSRDTASLTKTVSALVDQVNALLTSIDTKTAHASGNTAAGVLEGEPVAESLRDALLSTIFGDRTTSMATYGVQTDRYGKLVFNADTFSKAVAADPDGVAAKFTTGGSSGTDGWAARVASVADSASKYGGSIASSIDGHNSTVSRLTKSISDWDTRLELRRSTLEAQYTALETALSNVKSQGTWLQGQIASLPSWSS